MTRWVVWPNFATTLSPTACRSGHVSPNGFKYRFCFKLYFWISCLFFVIILKFKFSSISTFKISEKILWQQNNCIFEGRALLITIHFDLNWGLDQLVRLILKFSPILISGSMMGHPGSISRLVLTMLCVKIFLLTSQWPILFIQTIFNDSIRGIPFKMTYIKENPFQWVPRNFDL